MSLLARFQTHWIQQGFNKIKTPHLLALSGGIDSMTLAHLLLDSGIEFGVGHCNFKLRGKDADLDEQFVKDFAEANGLAYYSISFDTLAEGKERRSGIQETARDLRYSWLRQIRKDHDYGRILTAHHADDNAETLLMNLIRGTGMAGLHGITEVSDVLLRPLLFAEKHLINAYALDKGFSFRKDSSNDSDKYVRNAIRHRVVTALTSITPDAVARINENISRFAEAEMLYRKAVVQEVKGLLEKRGTDYYIPIRKLVRRQPLSTICYELFSPFGFGSGQVPDILKLLSAESGRYVASASHKLIRNRDFLILTSIKTEAADIIIVEPSFPVTIDVEGYRFIFTLSEKRSFISEDANVALLDLAVVSDPIVLRRWRTGDYFYPLGMGMKKKKLSRLFVDHKIPVHQKEQIWIVESGKRIAWVAGMRLDERFKIKDTTSRVLIITMKVL